MTTTQPELMEGNCIGTIQKLFNDQGFGFIEMEERSYYFKLRSCQFRPALGDRVVFSLNPSEKGPSCVEIRKLYENEYGVRFAARYNLHHIHLDLDTFLPNIIQIISNTDKEILEVSHKFNTVVGNTECVQVSETDRIVYGIRPGRLGFSKFVLGRKPMPCDEIFAVFKRVGFGYIVITIFIGRKASREPWDQYATEADLAFWQNHALIYDHNQIIEHTEISCCPWVLNNEAICRVNSRPNSRLIG